jgi:hypothetical protein
LRRRGLFEQLANEDVAYLATTGRGHTIEVRFALREGRVPEGRDATKNGG